MDVGTSSATSSHYHHHQQQQQHVVGTSAIISAANIQFFSSTLKLHSFISVKGIERLLHFAIEKTRFTAKAKKHTKYS